MVKNIEIFKCIVKIKGNFIDCCIFIFFFFVENEFPITALLK